MLLVFDSSQGTPLPVQGPLPARGWVHAESPSQAELDILQRSGIPGSLFPHALDKDELARVDYTDGVMLVVIRVPCRGGEDDAIPYRTTSLALLIIGELVVTISCRPSDVVAGVLQLRDPAIATAERLLPRLLLETARHFLRFVGEVEARVERLEEQLQVSQRNREVIGLLRYQKALVHFTTGLASNAIMLDQLSRDPHHTLAGLDRELMEDVTVEFHQAMEVNRIQEEILSQMMDAFASIISNNLNVVVKVLTGLTIVMSIPTMFASFYGMNVTLPGQQHPAAFAGVLVLSTIGAAAMALWFARKHWF